MSTTSQQRPPQVTLAAWIVIGGSAVLIAMAWEQIASLRSLATREVIEEFLKDPMVKGLGLDVETVISILHVSTLVLVACAVSAIILGWFALRGDRGARLGLTLLSVPMLVTGMATGGFLSSMVAVAPMMMWLSPSGEWFRTGKWTLPSAPTAGGSEEPRRPDPSAPSQQSRSRSADVQQGSVPRSVSQPPPAVVPFGTAPPANEGAAPGMHRVPDGAGNALHQRPAALVAAFVVTVLGAGLVFVAMGFGMLMMALSPDLLLSEMTRQRPDLLENGVTEAQLRASTLLSGTVVLVWCAAALTFAGFAMARRNWGRVALLITAALSAGVCLASALIALPALIPGVAAVATVVLLRRREVRGWFNRSPRDGIDA